MYKYDINVLECEAKLPFECDKQFSIILRFEKVVSNVVICGLYLKNNDTDSIFNMYHYQMENTSSLTFISFVKSVIPTVLENISNEKESVMRFVEVFEIQGDIFGFETKKLDSDVVGSEHLYDNIYTDLHSVCQELNIDSQILSTLDKEVVSVNSKEQEEKMLNAESDFNPHFEVLRNKLCEVSRVDISEKPKEIVIEDDEDAKYLSEFTRHMRVIEDSIKDSPDEFKSGKEYFLLCKMSDYMWQYLKSVNSKFPNPEFLGVCDYYLNTHGVFNNSARAFMIRYCVNKSKYK